MTWNHIGDAIAELGRGFGLIIRDIHRVMYRRFGARVWWFYIGISIFFLVVLAG